jgi:medium-chain acyl-[acyl-carrier-protein] hydrolase
MTQRAQEGDGRWLKRFGGRDAPAGLQLLCFHHAGGAAGMYRQWPRLVPPSVEPIAVQLPGRADRFREPAYERMPPLVDDLVEVVRPLLHRPFACYGASMGARVAWALTHALRERGLALPIRLYVASSSAPVNGTASWRWEKHPKGLEGYLREMGGTPAEVLAEPTLLAALLPTLRADLTVLSTDHFRPAVPLDVPIHAFAGTEDVEAPPERMAGWRIETAARFDLDLIPGGHFFDADGERTVIQTIAADLGARTPVAGP